MNQKFVTMMKESVPCIPMFIVEELFNQSSLKEELDHPEQVYYDAITGQSIFFTFHSGKERTFRFWWKDFKDPIFIDFAKKTLKVLNVQRASKYSKLLFKEKEEVAFVIKKDDKKWQAVIGSLRPNKDKRTYTSYAIITVLNKDKEDIPNKNELYIKADDGHQFIIDRYISSEEHNLEVEKIQTELKTKREEKNNLTDDLDYVILELEEITDPKEKKTKEQYRAKLKLDISTLERRIINLETKLKSLTIQESLTTFFHKDTGKKMYVYLMN